MTQPIGETTEKAVAPPGFAGTDVFAFKPETDAFTPDQATDEGTAPDAEKESTAAGADLPAGDEAPAGEGDNAAAQTPDAGGEPLNKPRFKDHAAAEEGYRNIQSKATKAEMELAEQKKRNEDLQRQIKKKEAADAAAKTAAEKERQLTDFREQRMEKVLEEIEELDADDENHNKNVARIWAAFYGDVQKYEQGITSGTITGETPAGATATGETPAVTAPEGEPPATLHPTAPGPAPAEVTRYIDDRARAAGIDPDADPYWNFFAMRSPAVDDHGAPILLDDQITWTVNEVNKKRAADRAAILANSQQPMDRGAGGLPTASTTAANKPVSLSDAISKANQNRVL